MTTTIAIETTRRRCGRTVEPTPEGIRARRWPTRTVSGTCRLDPHRLTITLHLPDGTTLTRQHDRSASLPVILASLTPDPPRTPRPAH